jgi:hypothetical protein
MQSVPYHNGGHEIFSFVTKFKRSEPDPHPDRKHGHHRNERDDR